MKILAIDTTAVSGSVSLADEEKIIGEYFINTKLTHSRTLIPMIENLLLNTNEKFENIDAIAVNVGPGSFTGVRIGVAAAKGMAFQKNLPCIEVSTLESMAYNMLFADCIVCCVMDARCNQVYNANFEILNQNVTRLCDDRALSIEDLTNELKNIDQKIILVGDGADLCYNYMKDIIDNIFLAPTSLKFQRASSISMIAVEKYKNNQTVTCENLLPAYLRLPQAERELKKKMEDKK